MTTIQTKLTRREFNVGASATLAAATAAGQASASTKAPFDLALLGGRVMDPETGFDQIANVGISGGRIAAITTESITGARAIDASGLVVCPGFIDTHHHWTRPMGYKLAMLDGRTSVMDLEFGTLGTLAQDWYEDRIGKTPINFGCSSSHELARALVLDDIETLDAPDAMKHRGTTATGWSHTRPDIDQGNAILAALDAGLMAGTVGIGSTLGYMRDGVSAREAFEIQKLAGHYGRPTAFHFRYTPGSDVMETNGIQELLANAAALGAPAIACHFNNPGYNLVHELLTRMRAQGMNVWGELYPYNAGSTTLNAVFLEPEYWVEELGYKYEETVQDAVTGEWYTEQSRREMLEKEPGRLILMYKMPDEAVTDWLKFPDVAIASDGMPIISEGITWDTPYEDLPNSHPRGAGAYARALRLGRESGVPLMQSVAQLSYNSARPLGLTGLKFMQERGRLQEGMIADITLFDPQTVTDRATYENGNQPSEGIPYVIVSGTVVVDDAQPVDDVKPGEPIRYEPTDSLREPLDQDHWTQSFTVVPHDFGGGVPHTQPVYGKNVISCCG